MKKIVWIASYPKSGNTYVRTFLTHYLYSNHKNLDFNLIKKIPKFESKKIFEKILEKNMIQNNFDFIKYSLKVQEQLIKQCDQSNLIFKTHYFFGNIENHLFTNTKNTLLFIYLVRDPREVLISYANHNNTSIDEQIKDFLPKNLMHSLGSEIIINWALHYKSWKSFKSVPSIFIRFEDLINFPIKNFQKLISFLSNYIDIKFDETILKQTIELTKFNKLKKLEKKIGFHEAYKNIKFFRSGKTDSWKKTLNKKQINKVEVAFYDVMKELNYL